MKGVKTSAVDAYIYNNCNYSDMSFYDTFEE